MSKLKAFINEHVWALGDDEGKQSSTPRPSVPSVTSNPIMVSTASSPSVAASGDTSHYEEAIIHDIDSGTAKPYTDFKAMVTELQDIPDVAKRHSKALQMVAKIHGHTPQAIKAALTARVELLEIERTQFAQRLKTESDVNVGGKERKVAEMDSQLAAIDTQLAQLQQQRTDLVTQQQTLRGQIQTGKDKTTAMQTSFDTAFAAVQKRLAEETSNLEPYLK